MNFKVPQQLTQELYLKLRDEWIDYLEKTYESYPFHSVEHTKMMLGVIEYMMEDEKVPIEERVILRTAVLFHDIEFRIGRKGHEKASADFAVKTLQKLSLHPTVIHKIKNLILATEFPRSPKNLLEKIICDADIITTGTKNHYRWTLADFEEKYLENPAMNLLEYLEGYVIFLNSNDFYTKWAQRNLTKQKKKNIEIVKEKIELIKSRQKNPKTPQTATLRNPVLTEIPTRSFAPKEEKSQINPQPITNTLSNASYYIN